HLAHAHRAATQRARSAMAAVTRKRSQPGSAPPLVVVADSAATAAETTDKNTIVVPPLSSLDYLATGGDVFLTHEPCAMCAMALVHARAAKVFYANRTKNGVLARREPARLGCLTEERGWQLHLEPALNHHYRVFEVVFEEDVKEEEKEERAEEKGVQEEEEGFRCGAVIGKGREVDRSPSPDIDDMDRGDGGQWEDEGEETD
ncbi:hypothetical protein PFISCL1PPCAC_12089, partial [Pristionchus fissidentatus]